MSSSSQDEIIEISNSSSSSLDNDFLKPFESELVHDTISILPTTTSNSIAVKVSSTSLSSSKTNKRYQSKFKRQWLTHSSFSTFLRECKADQTKALCITCNVQFSIQNSGLGDINRC